VSRGSFVIISGLVRCSRDPQIYERERGRSTIVIPVVWDTYRRKPEGDYDALGNFLDLKAYDKYQIEKLTRLHKGGDLGFAARLGSEEFTNRQTGQTSQRFVGKLLHFTFPYGKYDKEAAGVDREELVSVDEIRQTFETKDVSVDDDNSIPF